MARILRFPENFLWGTATSAHQIEGNNIHSDWWEWEHSEKRAKELEKEGKDPALFRSGKAADHWNRYEEDIALMKELNVNAYRCSIEWARIEPEEGMWDMEALEHYRREFQALRDAGISIMATLHHVTLPRWAAAKGGWANRNVALAFTAFGEYVFSALHKYVDYWVTLNEPLVYASQSFLRGIWPPQKHNPFLFFNVVSNQIRAHLILFDRFHTRDVYCQVGIAKNNQSFEPLHRWSQFDRFAAFSADWFWNRRFLNRLRQKFDFIGLNYYFHTRLQFPYFVRNENKKVSDLGWEIYPKGIEKVLLELSRYHRPIFITENGIADRDDRLRKEFIRDHLFYTHKAIARGANVRGYFHWSLLDNFEWADGFDPRFGLYEVNYETMERTARPSAAYYAKICETNELEIEE